MISSAQVAPGAWLQRQLGNLYTASLYSGLAGLIHQTAGGGLIGKRLLLFSFGSGVVASLFEVRCQSGKDQFTLDNIAQQVGSS